MINIAKPFLPPVAEYIAYVEQIWDRNWLTNNGPLVNELELRLKAYLNIDHFLFTANGTLALQIALRALDLKGEIITTPFSYVATSSAIVWEHCTPVYADINPDTLNIDPLSIESLITDKTVAIVATHTYGNPCDVDAIAALAEKHQLKVIYDAAHCFGTQLRGKSVFHYGDISITSFHATKIFHTIEGGGIFTPNPDLLKTAAYMRNFGHDGPEAFATLGINGKNSEFHAAMGLVNLKHIDHILSERKKKLERYHDWLKYLRVGTIMIHPEASWNGAYFPVVFETEAQLLKGMEILQGHYIYPRRYFYPTLNRLPYVQSAHTPHCDAVSNRVLCLPLYEKLSVEEIDFICRLLLRAQNN
jgi:dTDP-4-amino-4,6-dideoxygalactose transaminase